MIDYATWCALRDGISRHLSPPQLAESLGLDVKTVRHWIGRAYGPSASIRLRPTWRWRRRRWN